MKRNGKSDIIIIRESKFLTTKSNSKMCCVFPFFIGRMPKNYTAIPAAAAAAAAQRYINNHLYDIQFAANKRKIEINCKLELIRISLESA